MRWSIIRRSRLLLLAAAVPALTAAACQTVDLGQPPADINACRPGPQFFIDEIWPNVLYPAQANGAHCWDATCHGNLAPNALDLIAVDPAVNPGTLPLTGDWAANYMSVTEEMSCSNVASSALIEYPTGIRNHGGGKLWEPDGMEAMKIIMWISQL
jgi:hypothetical protein